MNWIKKLWYTEWLTIRINRKLILLTLALTGIYLIYSWGYVRGVNRVFAALQAIDDGEKKTTL